MEYRWYVGLVSLFSREFSIEVGYMEKIRNLYGYLLVDLDNLFS